jgi:hypothetical protein
LTIDEQITEIDKTIALLVKARRTLLAKANVSRELEEKQDAMENYIFYNHLILKPPIKLKE